MSFQVLHGDCRELMAAMEPGSIDALVSDPPYGLEFMGKEWDHGVPGEPFWREALRVLRPGSHVLAFGGTRTYHRLACALEDAGFEIRDCLSWLYGSGFPKSLDVSKAIDRGFRKDEANADYEWRPASGPSEDVYAVTAFVREARDRTGTTNKQIDDLFGFNGMSGHWTSKGSQPAVPTWPQWERLKELLQLGDAMDELVLRLNGGKGDRSIEGTALAEREVVGTARGKDAVAGDMYRPGGGEYLPKDYDLTKPATGAARAWEGWGTALKPAWEPIIVARKPLAGTVAANVLAHGTGALNVDGCRVAGSNPSIARRESAARSGWDNRGGVIMADRTDPANYAAPHPGELLGRWPANVALDEDAARQLDEQTGDLGFSGGTEVAGEAHPNGIYGARQKEGRGQIGKGDSGGASRFFYTAKAASSERHYAGKNTHPTVKPVDLMRWLCRLVTPPGGLVLDPFCGSGSTGVAALAEGFRFVGLELNAEYVEIARRRIAGPLFAETAEGEGAGA